MIVNVKPQNVKMVIILIMINVVVYATKNIVHQTIFLIMIYVDVFVKFSNAQLDITLTQINVNANVNQHNAKEDTISMMKVAAVNAKSLIALII